MIYSCFNEKLGLYEYFETPENHPVNGDLPIPTFSGLEAGKVGVPARDAGRQMPAGATRIGTGLAARGIIVSCSNMPVQGLSLRGAAESPADLQNALLWMGAGGVVGYLVEQQRDGRPIFGSLAGALFAGLLHRVVG